MPRYLVTDVKKGDIVLVEFNVSRWHRKPKAGTVSKPSTPLPAPAPEATSSKSSGVPEWMYPTWDYWAIDLNLLSVALLFKGSDYEKSAKPAAARTDTTEY